MNENHENMEFRANNNVHKEFLVKWLQVMFTAQVVVLLNLIVSAVPRFTGISTWISRGVSAFMVYALYKLSSVNAHYKKSFAFQAAGLVGGLAAGIFGGTLITLAVSICGIIGSYQEYHGHSDLAQAYDPKLAGHWRSLFYWEIVVSIVTGLLSSAAVVAGIFMDMDTPALTMITLIMISLVSFGIQFVYLMYLKRTKAIFLA